MCIRRYSLSPGLSAGSIIAILVTKSDSGRPLYICVCVCVCVCVCALNYKTANRMHSQTFAYTFHLKNRTDCDSRHKPEQLVSFSKPDVIFGYISKPDSHCVCS